MAFPLLTSIAIAGVWALLIALMRAPMETPSALAPLGVFLLAGGVMFTWRESTRRLLSGRGSYAPALLLTLAVLFSPALVWIPGGAAGPVMSVVLAAAWIVGLRGLVRDCRDVAIWQPAVAIATGMALGFVYFLFVNTKGYATVFSPEQTLLGTQHRDTLFHASIAGMLGQFGVPSTGLDGLVRVRYYFLSHALIGLTGRWIGVSPIHAYYLVNQILILPLLLFSVMAATFSLWRPQDGTRAGITAMLVPLLLLAIFEVWDWSSYLVSESYALSLSLLLLAVPLVMELQDDRRDTRQHVTVLRYATLALAALAIVVSKSSVGVLFAGGLFFAALRARVRMLELIAVFMIMVGVLAVSVAVTSTPAYAGDPLIGPLHFFKSYPDAAFPNMWAILLGVAGGGWAWMSAERIRRRHLEFLAAIALAALGCGLLFRIGSGSAYYFMNVGVWVAIVLGGGAFILPRLQRVGHEGVVAVVLVASLAAATWSAADKRHAASKLVALALNVDSAAVAQGGGPVEPLHPAPTLSTFLSPRDPIRRQIADVVRDTPGARIGARIAADPQAEVVYVPPTNAAFWGMSKTMCTAPPFFVPAIAARPLVRGLPPDPVACPLPVDTGFGYFNYEEGSRSTAMSDTELCAAVQRLGFKTVLVLTSADESRAVACR